MGSAEDEHVQALVAPQAAQAPQPPGGHVRHDDIGPDGARERHGLLDGRRSRRDSVDATDVGPQDARAQEALNLRCSDAKSAQFGEGDDTVVASQPGTDGRGEWVHGVPPLVRRQRGKASQR